VTIIDNNLEFSKDYLDRNVAISLKLKKNLMNKHD